MLEGNPLFEKHPTFFPVFATGGERRGGDGGSVLVAMRRVVVVMRIREEGEEAPRERDGGCDWIGCGGESEGGGGGEREGPVVAVVVL